MNTQRIPPHSVDAERCVIGTILLSNRALDEISLLPEDFYRDAHRDIFQAITTLRSSGAPADLVTICEFLKASDKLERVGGPAYLSSLTDIIPSVANIGHYAKIVSDHKKRREAIVSASNIIGMAYESVEIESLTEAAQTAFFAMEGKEVSVECHHEDGIDWQGVVDLVRERILAGKMLLLCKNCHDEEHGKK